MNISWETPRAFRSILQKQFRITLDAAASYQNRLAVEYIDEEMNALIVPWVASVPGVVWCNPPYSRLSEFTARAADQAIQHDLEILYLIPAYTDTRYWHQIILPTAAEIIFLKGRMRFELDGKPHTTARFPSALIWWIGQRPSWQKMPLVSWWDWKAEVDDAVAETAPSV